MWIFDEILFFAENKNCIDLKFNLKNCTCTKYSFVNGYK